MTNWTQSNHDPDWPIRAQALLASFHPGGAGARTRKEQHEAPCFGKIVYKVLVSGKEAGQAVVRFARMQVWPGPQSAFGHWWRGAVRDPEWKIETLAAVPPELPAECNFRGLLFHRSLQGLDGTTLQVPDEPLARPDSALK